MYLNYHKSRRLRCLNTRGSKYHKSSSRRRCTQCVDGLRQGTADRGRPRARDGRGALPHEATASRAHYRSATVWVTTVCGAVGLPGRPPGRDNIRPLSPGVADPGAAPAQGDPGARSPCAAGSDGAQRPWPSSLLARASTSNAPSSGAHAGQRGWARRTTGLGAHSGSRRSFAGVGGVAVPGPTSTAARQHGAP